VTGVVVMWNSPCYVPGDVVKATAVRCPALEEKGGAVHVEVQLHHSMKAP
jgi:hypothetical protein